MLFTTAVSAQEKPIANAENISQISIGSTSMFMDQHEKYNLNIYYPETKYIAYRINSISGDQKRITPVSDGNSLMITVNYSNGEQFIFSVEPYGISINSDLGYVIQKADYNRFLNLLADVKKNKLSLPQTLDFEPSEWAKNHINKSVAESYLPKWLAYNYKDPLTRLELAQLVESFAGTLIENDFETASAPFDDTSDISVTKYASLGIFKGKPEALFCPYDYLTREELSCIAGRILNHVYKQYINETDYILDYSDKADISDWAYSAVALSTKAGVLLGDSNKRFMPKNFVTKEEAVEALYRILTLQNCAVKTVHENKLMRPKERAEYEKK